MVLVRTRVGGGAARRTIGVLSSGDFDLAHLDRADVGAAIEIDYQYPDLGLGLTDASLVVLAERYRTIDILTLDERHFRALTPRYGGRAFRILPADA